MEPSTRVYLKKVSLSIIVVLRQTFLNTFIKIPISGKLYQCSNCYAKLEPHWIEYICVLSNPIIQCLVHEKISALHFSAVSQKFPNCDLLIRTLRPDGFKNSLMVHSDYLVTITTICKSFLNKKMLLSIIVVSS